MLAVDSASGDFTCVIEGVEGGLFGLLRFNGRSRIQLATSREVLSLALHIVLGSYEVFFTMVPSALRIVSASMPCSCSRARSTG